MLLQPGKFFTFALFLLIGCGTAVFDVFSDEPEPEAQKAADTPKPTDAELAAMVKQLDASAFDERERASAALRSQALQHRELMKEQLVKVYKADPSPEVRYRVYNILLDLAADARPDAKPGFLGIMMRDAEVSLPDGKVATSISVMQVVQDSAAARAGLQVNDHIIAIDGREMQAGDGITDTASARFSEYVRGKPAQAEVELSVFSPRRRAVNKIQITLGERPDALSNSDYYKRTLANDVVKEWIGQQDK
ncbi:MAG: PDZ domain-containing protein, partial [Verrucomicrobiales bacterium]